VRPALHVLRARLASWYTRPYGGLKSVRRCSYPTPPPDHKLWNPTMSGAECGVRQVEDRCKVRRPSCASSRTERRYLNPTGLSPTSCPATTRRRQRMPPRLPSLLRTERDRTERPSPCDLFQSSVSSGGATCGGMREGGREALAANSDQGQGTRSAGRYTILQALHRSSELLQIGPPYEFDPSVEPVFLRF
jgi:hypothetical protein